MQKIKQALSALACVTVFMSGAASAAVFTTVGDSVQVNYGGIVGGNSIEGLNASTTYLLEDISDDGLSWSFSGTLTNTSSVDSRVSLTGFDTTSGIDIGASEAGGAFSRVSSGKLPQGLNADICLKNTGGANCAGGGGSGAWNAGDTLAFTFTIQLLEGVGELGLDDFSVRYQSISGIDFGSSGVGGATSVAFLPAEIPLPASAWLLLSALTGLGLVKKSRRGA